MTPDQPSSGSERPPLVGTLIVACVGLQGNKTPSISCVQSGKTVGVAGKNWGQYIQQLYIYYTHTVQPHMHAHTH